MAERNYLAFDLGAESGRTMLGRFDGKKLELEQVHRFGNGPIKVHQNLYWNILKLFDELKSSLRIVAQKYGTDIQGIGIDTWGVDFGLLDANDELLGNPHAYRDPRTSGMLDEAFRRVPRSEIYDRTGIQFMQFNSVFQLLAMTMEKSPILECARTFLMMPDLLNFWFTGAKVCEFSNATTTQFFDPRKGDWSTELLDKLGIQHGFLPQIVDPGTVIGKLTKSISEDTGLGQVPFIVPATHDTGSAVAAVPAKGKDHIYLSSGTWSLMGCELSEPLINDRVLEMNFTNEGGIGRSYRFLKNIMGLWLVQECRRTWAQAGEELSYSEITQMAGASKPYVSVVDVDDIRFLTPGDMPSRIRDFCRETGQVVPEDKGAVVRCALDSLALKYRWTAERLEEALGRKLGPIHIIGGGTQNTLLCQLTANATGKQVIAGPIEATAMGNILVQAIGLGHLKGLDEAREVVRNSSDLVTYDPQSDPHLDDAYATLLKVMKE